MNVEIETETALFLFWDYLLQIFAFVSLQRREENMMPYNGRLEREQRKKGACSEEVR